MAGKTNAPFKVRAIQTGFLESLRFVNDTFMCPNEEAFAPNWMQRLDDQGAAADQTAPLAALDFTIKHVPAGNYVVLNKDGQRFSRVFKRDEGNAKELAEAEAVRLNAGGEPLLPGPSGGGVTPAAETEVEDATDPTLPDA